jgi:hypothetical protein
MRHRIQGWTGEHLVCLSKSSSAPSPLGLNGMGPDHALSNPKVKRFAVAVITRGASY